MRMHRTHASPIGGLFLIGLGLFFLLAQFLNLAVWRYLWPFFIVGFGMLFFAGMVLTGREGSTGGLAIPGSLFVTMGLIFFFQTVSNHWASWAYAWTLLAPTSIGVGLMIHGWWNNRTQMYQPGLILIGLGIAMFVIFGGFFELVIGIAGFASPARILWPLMLIALGVVLLIGRGLRWPQATHQATPAMGPTLAAPKPDESQPSDTNAAA